MVCLHGRSARVAPKGIVPFSPRRKLGRSPRKVGRSPTGSTSLMADVMRVPPRGPWRRQRKARTVEDPFRTRGGSGIMNVGPLGYFRGEEMNKQFCLIGGI